MRKKLQQRKAQKLNTNKDSLKVNDLSDQRISHVSINMASFNINNNNNKYKNEINQEKSANINHKDLKNNIMLDYKNYKITKKSTTGKSSKANDKEPIKVKNDCRKTKKTKKDKKSNCDLSMHRFSSKEPVNEIFNSSSFVYSINEYDNNNNMTQYIGNSYLPNCNYPSLPNYLNPRFQNNIPLINPNTILLSNNNISFNNYLQNPQSNTAYNNVKGNYQYRNVGINFPQTYTSSNYNMIGNNPVLMQNNMNMRMTNPPVINFPVQYNQNYFQNPLNFGFPQTQTSNNSFPNVKRIGK